MRRTGSLDPRESLDASATSLFSIAVKTFSIRLGSRRNQRPAHQKTRSITTVRPMIDTIKIGHMIGPPFRKLSMRKLPVTFVSAASAAADAAGEGLRVTGTLWPGAGDVNAPAGDVPGAPGASAGDMPAAGGGIGWPGWAGDPAAGAPGGPGGGGGGF